MEGRSFFCAFLIEIFMEMQKYENPLPWREAAGKMHFLFTDFVYSPFIHPHLKIYIQAGLFDQL